MGREAASSICLPNVAVPDGWGGGRGAHPFGRDGTSNFFVILFFRADWVVGQALRSALRRTAVITHDRGCSRQLPSTTSLSNPGLNLLILAAGEAERTLRRFVPIFWK